MYLILAIAILFLIDLQEEIVLCRSPIILTVVIGGDVICTHEIVKAIVRFPETRSTLRSAVRNL